MRSTATASTPTSAPSWTRTASGATARALIEDFGLPETTMLWAEARRLFVIVTQDVMSDVTGLQLCLQALREYVDE